jgi:hypothetical protein
MNDGRAGRHQAVVDLDLHGILGIRLIDPSAGDIAAVVGQVGAVPRPLSNEPEVVVRFVDRVRLPSGVRFIGLDEAAFDDDRFYVLRGKGRARTAVQVAFEGIGERCEIVCESGTRHVPLLVAIVNMTALSKGFLPLHASAFSYDGTGVLVMGWTKGGKTETLLAFMANGAAYIGDEWVYLAADGGRMYGLSQPITVWDWHLDDLPRYRALLGRRERSRLMASRVVQGVKREAPARVIRSRAVERVLGLAEGQLSARISPAELFGADSCLPHARLDKVFLLVSHDSPEVTAAALDPGEVARRMNFSLRYERFEFISDYLKFRFAFPDAANSVIDRADEFERNGLTTALAGKQAYAIHHPYPAPIPALFDVIAPLL